MNPTNGTERNTWMVRSGGGGLLIDEFLKENIAAIGWNDLGEISLNMEYHDLKELFMDVYPDSSSGSAGQGCGQIWRFIHEMKIGDEVITYDPSSRLYYVGTIKSDYKYHENLTYYHYRKVEWEEEPRSRDALSVEAKNILGSVLTVFKVSAFIARELEEAHPGYISEEDMKEMEDFISKEEAEKFTLKSDVVSKSNEFIKDKLVKLEWEDAEKLVAGILRAMGYKTRFTARTRDLGSDIFASPDGLGLEEPNIKVEVKKRTNQKIGSEDIRSFIGGMRGFHKGIYVATTGFTIDAKYEAERANFPITLVDADLLVELITENYEQLSPEVKALVPLRKIYWPA